MICARVNYCSNLGNNIFPVEYYFRADIVEKSIKYFKYDVIQIYIFIITRLFLCQRFLVWDLRSLAHCEFSYILIKFIQQVWLETEFRMFFLKYILIYLSFVTYMLSRCLIKSKSSKTNYMTPWKCARTYDTAFHCFMVIILFHSSTICLAICKKWVNFTCGQNLC